LSRDDRGRSGDSQADKERELTLTEKTNDVLFVNEKTGKSGKTRPASGWRRSICIISSVARKKIPKENQ